MKTKTMAFLLVLISSPAYAAADPVKEYSRSVQEGAAAMQACGESFGHPYSGIPQILNDKYFRLLKLSGKKFPNPESHHKKIKLYLEKERESQQTQGDCKSRLLMMKGFVSRMDKDIQALESPETSKP